VAEAANAAIHYISDWVGHFLPSSPAASVIDVEQFDRLTQRKEMIIAPIALERRSNYCLIILAATVSACC
jgi:hypothetical protein